MRTPLAIASAIATLAIASSAAVAQAFPAEKPGQAWETKTRKLKDGVVMTADFYALPPRADPGAEEGAAARWGVAVCLHQAGASRGEWRAIAPTLNELGLDVLAVDLRAGGRKFMLENETAKAHLAATQKPASVAECYDDVVVALRWARELSPEGPLIVFGSAQSAALAIMAAAREKDAVDALALFSPGEFVMGVAIWEVAGEVTVPVYATCGPGSKESSWLRASVQKIPEENLIMFSPGRAHTSLHGAPTLLVGDEANRDLQWRGVKELFERVKP